MFLSKKKHKKTQLQTYIEYAIHIWFIIFISNVVVFLGFRFFTLAADNPTKGEEYGFVEEEYLEDEIKDTTATPSATITLAPDDITNRPMPSPTPEGPIVKLSFSIPGIGTEGGNLKPLRPEREIGIYFYDADANIADKKVRPLHIIKTKAVFDNNPQSPTYLQFINNYVDLGPEVIGLKSQVGIKTSQTLIKVIKGNDPKAIGGEVFTFKKEGRLVVLPPQKMIIGDIYPIPESDNFMDINDYNMLINCFGEKASTKKCISGSTADLDDNGIIDGTDYNLMLLSFQELKEMGFPVPQLEEKPKIVINPIISTPLEKIKKFINSKPTNTPQPTKAPVKKAGSTGGGNLGIILLFIFLIVAAVIAFVVFKFGLLNKLLKRNSKPAEEPQTQTEQQPESAPAIQDSSDTPSPLSASPADVLSPSQTPPADAQQPETPGSRIDPENTKSAADVFGQPSASQTGTPQPESSTPPPAISTQQTPDDGTVEKSGFVKKVNFDQEKNGTWITIADDTGITKGFINKPDVADGFAKVKGIMKTDAENKKYLEVSSLTPEE